MLINLINNLNINYYQFLIHFISSELFSGNSSVIISKSKKIEKITLPSSNVRGMLKFGTRVFAGI